MAIDREETLRKAEKLLRQGRLDAAIAEYERVAESYTGDLVTVDKLGDLYQRAGRTADATTCYGRVADHWLLEGLHAKAATKYKKILKLTPDDELAMLQLVEATAQQGLLGEAKTFLRAALERRLARGDARGADELTLKLADLDPNDFEAWLNGLKLRVRDNPEADLAPVLRDAMVKLDGKGRRDEADALALSVIDLDPDDVASRVRAARAALARGEHDAVRALLLEPAESDSYDIVLIATELALTDAAERRQWLERLLTLDRVRAASDLAAFGDRLVAQDADAAYACIETLADHHAVSSEFRQATDLVTHFLVVSPTHLSALLRLVELCVDGDFDDELTDAQARLADVYLQVGQSLQAKVIAEDLLSRDPRSAVHRDRLHRALVALGTADPDEAIAELLGSVEEALGEELAMAPPPKPVVPPALEEPDFGLGVTSPAAAFGVESALDGLETPWAGEEGPAFQAADLGGLGPPEAPVAARDASASSASVSSASSASIAGSAAESAADGVSEGAAEIAAEAAAENGDSEQESATPKGRAARTRAKVSDARRVAKPAAVAAAPQAHPDAQALPQTQTPPQAQARTQPQPQERMQPQPPAQPHAPLPPEEGARAQEQPQVQMPPPARAIAAAPRETEMRVAPPVVAAPATSPAALDDDLDLTQEIDLTAALDALAEEEGRRLGTSRRADSSTSPGASTPSATHIVKGRDAGGQAAGGLAAGVPLAGAGAEADAAGEADEDDDLEAFFESRRERAADQLADLPQTDQSVRLLAMAETYQAAGMMDEAEGALEQAAADPRYRFRAALALGRLLWREGRTDAALGWLGQASEAPAPTPEDAHAVLYELAERLETAGETTRALAVLLDLVAEQEDYRDARARIDRLVRYEAEP